MAGFEGWDVYEWLKGVIPLGSEAKEVVKILLPLLVFWLATGSLWQTAFGTIAGKAVLDIIHYFLKE